MAEHIANGTGPDRRFRGRAVPKGSIEGSGERRQSKHGSGTYPRAPRAAMRPNAMSA
jgi:hypothetical protein